jgi:tetratricopeptide (TPR) repeat protein
MKYVISFLVFVLFISCATSTPKKNGMDLSDIKKEDFKTIKQVQYRKSDDKFTNATSEYSAASNSESLQRIYKYDGEIELKDELGRLAKLCYENNFSDAYQYVKIINKKFIKNPIFWNQVGTCYLLQGERRKALLFYNKALSLKRNYSPSLNNLGVMYVNESDYSRALIAFKRAKSAKSFSKTPRFNLANLYLNFGLYDKAIKELKVLYQVSKKDIDVKLMLGSAYLMKNQPKLARPYFLGLDSDFTEQARFGLNYAMTEFLLGNTERAEDIFNDINSKKLGVWSKYYSEVKTTLKLDKN